MRYICAVSAGTFWGKIKKDRKGMSKTVLATVREASVTINQHLEFGETLIEYYQLFLHSVEIKGS